MKISEVSGERVDHEAKLKVISQEEEAIKKEKAVCILCCTCKVRVLKSKHIQLFETYFHFLHVRYINHECGLLLGVYREQGAL